MVEIKLPLEKVAQLHEADRELHDVLPQLDAYDKCGGDTTDLRAVILDARNRIQNVLKHFGPEQ